MFYMMVTSDKYELPMIVTKTVIEMSEVTGASRNYISSAITRRIQSTKYGGKFIRVDGNLE